MLDKLNCVARARHIAAKLDGTADYLSRPKEAIVTERAMNPQALRLVLEKSGTPNIDLFATYKNHKLLTYVLLFLDRQAEGGVNHYHSHIPRVPTTRYKSKGSSAAEAKLMRLQTNHSRLNTCTSSFQMSLLAWTVAMNAKPHTTF